MYHQVCLFLCFFLFGGGHSPHWDRASSFPRILDHTQRRFTDSRTPLDEWSARRRDLYLTTHKTHSRQTSIPPVAFEPTISGRRAVTDLRLRPRGQWGRRTISSNNIKLYLLPTQCILIQSSSLVPCPSSIDFCRHQNSMFRKPVLLPSSGKMRLTCWIP